MTKINPKKIESFTAWLSSAGAEILRATNCYELLRYRARCGVGVLYKSGAGVSVNAPHVLEAYECFATGAVWQWKGVPTRRGKGSKTKQQLIARDGPYCFYCGKEFEPADLTREHLLSVNQGGPDRIENMALACGPCNGEAGHMAIVEKVKLRERRHIRFQCEGVIHA